jgi:hypothetical protein
MLENLLLNITELADTYGAVTLINNLGKDYNYYFLSTLDKTDIQILSKAINEIKYSPPTKENIEIIFLSDICPQFMHSNSKKAFAIDLSILKAAKKPHTNDEKKKILEKYNIKKTDKPLAVIGNTYYEETHLPKIIKGIEKHAQIIISGSNYSSMPLKEHFQISDIQEIGGYGILADLYSIADIAIPFDDARTKRMQPLHNFFEQTQGGPSFFIPPSNKEQYGFKYFKNNELVVLCNHCDEIIDKVRDYASKFTGNKTHKNKWLEHQKMTEETYLPKIKKIVNYLMSTEQNRTKNFQYKHPETNWGRDFPDSIDLFKKF